MINSNDIQKALVIGAGTMGHGIAQTLAMVGIETRIVDLDEDALGRAMKSVQANLDKGVARGKVTEEQHTGALANISTTTDLASACEGVQIAIEAAPEIIDLKKKIFADLSSKLGADVLLATNTSSLPITDREG